MFRDFVDSLLDAAVTGFLFAVALSVFVGSCGLVIFVGVLISKYVVGV